MFDKKNSVALEGNSEQPPKACLFSAQDHVCLSKMKQKLYYYEAKTADWPRHLQGHTKDDH